MIETIANINIPILIGRLGENERLKVKFDDATTMLEEYPTADIILLVKRPNDTDSYPAAYTEVVDDVLYWTVTSADLKYEGVGSCELKAVVGDVVAKSIIYTIQILPALDGSAEAPEPWVSWQDMLTALKNEAVSAAQNAEASATSANDAAEAIQDMSVEANTLVPESPAMVMKIVDSSTGAVTLRFGIPRGPQGSKGDEGDKGATFIPQVSNAGVISWTNDGDLPNPQPVDIAFAVTEVFVVRNHDLNPEIHANANTRYICDTVESITFYPSEEGICDFIFTCGATAANLSVPSYIRWPTWFDPANLKPYTTYELNVSDMIYGAVMVWG